MNFSVLMSVYQKEKPRYFNRAMKSIWDDQLLKPNQIILIKDGPLTGDLDKAVDDWQEKLGSILIVVVLPQNRGLGAALNEGLQYCKYDLVARMDTDDIALPKRFSKQVEFFDKNADAVVVGTNIIEFYESEYSQERKYPIYTDKNSKTIYKGTPVAHPSVMIKTDVLQKYRYITTTPYSQDIDLWFRLLRDGHRIDNINESLLRYRITDNTFLRRNYRKAFYEFKVYCANLIKLQGFSILLFYPLCRLISRLLPPLLIKKLYFSKRRLRLFSQSG
jgi:glycosyltransferase involved in cell wall biosynthesis